MNEKITWFEEMLALEPNSKLFLPLAQAYVQQARISDAADVLRKGLSFHPEHLEARLLLVRCLAEMNDRNAALDHCRRLAATISAFPIFWELWAEHSKTEANQDFTLALRLLSISLHGEAIPWGTILEQGLRSVLSQEKPAHDASAGDSAAPAEISRTEQKSTAPDHPGEPETVFHAPTENTGIEDTGITDEGRTALESPKPLESAAEFTSAKPEENLDASLTRSLEDEVEALQEPDADDRNEPAKKDLSASPAPPPAADDLEALDEPDADEQDRISEEELPVPPVPAAADAAEVPADSSANRIQARIPLPRPEDIPGYATRLADARDSTPPPLSPDESGGRKSPETPPEAAPEKIQEDADSMEQLTEKEKKYYETRTYAELLADQGEVQEALDLLKKLLRSSTDPEQRRDLKQRIQALKDHGQNPSEPPESQSHGHSPDAAPSESGHAETRTAPQNPELVNTLNRLAQRLEARAQR